MKPTASPLRTKDTGSDTPGVGGPANTRAENAYTTAPGKTNFLRLKISHARAVMNGPENRPDRDRSRYANTSAICACLSISTTTSASMRPVVQTKTTNGASVNCSWKSFRKSQRSGSASYASQWATASDKVSPTARSDAVMTAYASALYRDGRPSYSWPSSLPAHLQSSHMPGSLLYPPGPLLGAHHMPTRQSSLWTHIGWKDWRLMASSTRHWKISSAADGSSTTHARIGRTPRLVDEQRLQV
mmetsp:Transcript_75890/g.197881  ORF Transcript_75890/g.197881 Transcript_75890/m.197881 type:complete len:244 (-) Transcript_75890:493-1224(-)